MATPFLLQDHTLLHDHTFPTTKTTPFLLHDHTSFLSALPFPSLPHQWVWSRRKLCSDVTYHMHLCRTRGLVWTRPSCCVRLLLGTLPVPSLSMAQQVSQSYCTWLPCVVACNTHTQLEGVMRGGLDHLIYVRVNRHNLLVPAENKYQS